MKHIAIIAVFLMVLASPALAQDVHVVPRAKMKLPAAATAPAGVVEVTRTDIATLAALRSDSLITFGVRLGDSEDRLRQAATTAGLKLQALDDGRCCSALDEYSNQVAFFDLHDGRVARVTWFPALGRHMPGRGGDIFKPEIADPDSPLRLEVLGREDRSKAEGGMWPTVTYFYDREGIRIFRISNVGASLGHAEAFVHVELVPSAKPR